MFYQMVMISNTPPPPFHFIAMDPERLKRKEEIEKALGFIQYVILCLFCYLLHARD